MAVATLWSTVAAARSAVDWFAGGDAAASEISVGVAATVPTCPTARQLYGVADEAVPADLRAAIDALLAHPDIVSREVSMSVWVDGWGEVVAHQPDVSLKPASNQKVIVAIGALELLDPEARLRTRLLAAAAPSAGTIDGDLVLEGGGDPTFWDVGPGSLYELAEALADHGVTRVTGSLWADESRYDQVRRAPGWTDRQIPGDAAPISALTVRANRLFDTPEYLADPATGNLGVFLQYLADVGITVEGGVGGTVGDTADLPAPATHELAFAQSPPIARLVQLMLTNSDNVMAELLVKEIDRAAGGPGSTAGGLAAAARIVEAWCVSLDGIDDDGSGLSYANSRSAREWRQMLQVAQQQAWWPTMRDGLPVAGDPDGTLKNRLKGPSTIGNLRGKTGTINVARALSGTFTTAGGRAATFSVIINDDDDPGPALGRTDLLLERIAAQAG